ncbi:MAG: substrate-binding periplasmic protein [Desulfovibrio sp.]|uniref:substrate-binding periplasmic protein n=1 Tax=Desulfovibrio sp. 7SRBS1 TaxID=3378064 RepID=UPI003B407752
MLKQYILLFCFCLFLIGGGGVGSSWAGHVALASLEWVPYTGARLPEKGSSSLVVSKAFEAAGYSASIKFFPWKRVVRMSVQGHVDGYFPVYFSLQRSKIFIFSNQIGLSPIGFIEPVGHHVDWKTLDDLKGLRIGVVDGFVNTAEFDAMVASGELNVDSSMEDITNIKKLALGRLDLAVIDKRVFTFLMQSEPSLREFKDKVVFNDKLLELKGLYVCFLRTEKGRRLVKVFNEGLGKLDWQSVQEEYFQSIMK